MPATKTAHTLRWALLLLTAGLFLPALHAGSAAAHAAGSSAPDDSIVPQWSLKNNLLYDATATPNLGIELRTGRRTTLQLFYGLNPWNGHHGLKKLQHWSLMPEWRYWLGSKDAFKGWFTGLHAVGGEYNAGGVKLPLGLFRTLRTNHYEGWYAGGGVTLGHAWRLGTHWNLEAALGLGYLHTRYDKYQNRRCGDLLATEHRNYVGPTKLALNVAYVLGRKRAVPVVVEELPVIELPAAEELQPPHFELAYAVPKAEAEKARELSGSAYLDFVVNKTDINPAYRSNQQELDKVIATINTVRRDPNTGISHISIHGYASPEGSYQNNTRLAEGRAQAFKDYIQSLIELPPQVFSVESTPEDWQGLAARLTAAGAQTAAPAAETLAVPPAVLAIVNDPALAPDQKERQLKQKHPAEWRRMLQTVFPALRHSDYTVSYVIRPFTIDEARQLIATKPQQLSLNEMFLVAQTLEPGSPEFSEVFEVAVRIYPDDPTANLNAAVNALMLGNLPAAERYLLKAGNSPEAELARQALTAKRQNPAVRISAQGAL